MKLIEIKCPNCGSPIKVRPDTSSLYCPYCRTEMYIDDDVAMLDRKLNSMTSAYDRLKKTDINEKIETGKIEIEKRKVDNALRRSSTITSLIGLAGLLLIMIVCFTYYSWSSNNKPNSNLVSMPFASSEYKNEQYEVIVQRLQDAGFTNIKIEKIDDLVTGFLVKDGEVKTVTINGLDKFSQGDEFHINAKITVSYHTFPDKKD